MRGQWLSTTRKLNRHYQSGQGGDHWTLLSGMLDSCICGFEYEAPVSYPTPIYDEKAFYTDDPRNIIVAPMYKLFNSLPTTHTQETNVRVQYGIPYKNSQGLVWIPDTTTFALSTITPVWRYGDIKGEPYWAYEKYRDTPNDGFINWAEGTWTDPNTNQNGIYTTEPDQGFDTWASVYDTQARAGTMGRFETAYSGKDVDVVIPVYEVLAVMDPGVSPNSAPGAIITDSPLNTRFPNEIKLKNYPRGAQPVPATQETWSHNVLSLTDGLYSYSPRPAPSRTQGGFTNMELGSLCGGPGFSGDVVLVFLADYSTTAIPSYISAGRYVDPDSGVPINMIYAIRLKYLEHKVVQPATRVLPDRIIPYYTHR